MTKPTTKQDRSNWSPSRRRAQQIAEDALVVAAAIDQAERVLRDARAGQPGSGWGNGGGSSSNASPVEAAIGLNGGDPDGDAWSMPSDQAAATLAALSKQLKQSAVSIALCRTITTANNPHPPTDKQRASVANDNDILCEHCTRHRPTGKVEPVHATGDVGGILKPVSLGLCRWCYDFVRRYERLPSKTDIDRHTKGLRAKVPAAQS